MKLISQHVELQVKFPMTLKEVLYYFHKGPSSLGGRIPSRHPNSNKQLPNLEVSTSRTFWLRISLLPERGAGKWFLASRTCFSEFSLLPHPLRFPRAWGTEWWQEKNRQHEWMVIRNYVNVTSDVGQDEVVCFFNLIFHAGLGWGCGRHGVCPTFTARGGSLPATGESQLWGACPNGEGGWRGLVGEGWGLASAFRGPLEDSATEDSRTSCRECHFLRL